MKKIATHREIIIKDPDKEVTVEVSYRCFFTETKAFYPMTVLGSIHNHCSLQKFISDGLNNYKKDYLKVEVVKVEIDEEELNSAIKQG